MSAAVHIVIPTWQRPVKLARCLASIGLQTYQSIRTHVIEDTDRLFAFGVWNRFLRDWTDGDYFVYLCDDTELDPGCIEAAVTRIAEAGAGTDAVLGFIQRNIHGKTGTCASAMGMVGRQFAERFPDRRVFCPDYSRFHADSELGRYARLVGRFYQSPGAALDHFHPAHYKSEMDATHTLVRDPAKVSRDNEVWAARERLDFIWGKTFDRIGGRHAN